MSAQHTASARSPAVLVGHYQLGDCLGRGAFGSVHRGLNLMTGETVAVKQIRLGNIPKSELGEIMAEIDLLKNLKHANIVKYKGSEKTKEYLYIILEYCENGSLHHICKRFGKFPEGLVGVYISQVLDGLMYLHDQGVIHRDIKGANILTNKDGSVKLADFGVATKAGSLLSNNAVVGSPYWMAPEVIDQSGATTASDIWSVGCVVIELLQGKPPYHFLDPMPALFRIVQDDCPPLPKGASPIVKDFLLHCFQKDANLRISARKLSRHPWILSARRQLEQMRSGGSLKGPSVHDEAVKSVQEWNEALKEPVKGASQPRDPQVQSSTSRRPPNSRDSRLLDRSAVGPMKEEHNVKQAPSSRDATNHAPVASALVDSRSNLDIHSNENDADVWDDDFEEGIPTTKLEALDRAPIDHFEEAEDDFATIKPFMRHASEGKENNERQRQTGEAVSVLNEGKIDKKGNMDGSSKPSIVRTALQERRSLGDYAEQKDDEDFSDLIDDRGSSAPLQLVTRLSSKSWKGDEDLEDDPFGEMGEDEYVASADMAANIARDKHARMCAHTVELFQRLTTQTPEDDLIETCDELELLLTEQPEMKVQALAAHGALTVLQLLEIIQIRDVISRLLGLLNVIIYQDPQAQENLCLIGAIPVVMPFCSKRYPHHVRIEAAHFIFSMCSTSTLTLQFVLSCRGLKTLVELIDEDYTQHKDLVWLGIACVNSVLELQSPASRNDFCRMLATEGLLEPLSTALLSVLDDDEDQSEYTNSAKEHILQIFLIYSSSEQWLKQQVATRHVLRRFLQACAQLDPESLTYMLKAIKGLTMSPSILDDIENCNAIEVLVRTLAQHHDGPCGTEISNQILNAMYNLCRLNKRRQEEAAQAGVIPQLLRIVRASSPLKQFALPILCDMTHASKSTRKMLSQQCGIGFFLELLQDPNWQLQSLESIQIWLQEDLARIEDVLLRPAAVQALLYVFVSSKTVSFENHLETFLKIFKLSSGITLALGKQSLFVKRLLDRLQTSSKAVVRLNLLRICKAIGDVHPNLQSLIRHYHLLEVLDRLSRDDGAVLVRELAREIATQLREPSSGPSLLAKDAHRTVRRAASESSVAGSSSNGFSSEPHRGPLGKAPSPSSVRQPTAIAIARRTSQTRLAVAPLQQTNLTNSRSRIASEEKFPTQRHKQ